MKKLAVILSAVAVVAACGSSELGPDSSIDVGSDGGSTPSTDGSAPETDAAANPPPDAAPPPPCLGAPGGQSCGQGMVCDGRGACVACAAGTACKASSPCKIASISCAIGAPVCTDTANVAVGTFCGDPDAGTLNDFICENGACNACTVGAACTPANPCHKGHLESCTGHPAACIDEGSDADVGTTCGVDKVCNAGACVDCAANVACTPANNCHEGLTSCATGTSVCVDQNTNVANGTTCGDPAHKTFCTNGDCACATGAHACADGVCYSNGDAAHCGPACVVCTQAPAGGSPACYGDACTFRCGVMTCIQGRATSCSALGGCACGSNPQCGSGAFPANLNTRCELSGTCTCDPTTCNPVGGCCSPGPGGACLLGDPSQNFTRCYSGGDSCVSCGQKADRCVAGKGCSCGPAVGGVAQPCAAPLRCVGATCVP